MTSLIHTVAAAEPQEPVPTPRRLASLLDDTLATFPTVRLTYPPADAVVLAVRDQQVDVVLEHGIPRTVDLNDTAELINNPAREVALLGMAMGTLRTQVLQARQAQQRDEERQRQTLRDIRAYAIGKRRDGVICQDGLEEFLRHFDMDPVEVLVHFTITGSYRVDEGDCDDAESDGTNLDVNFDDIDGFVAGSANFHVSIDSAQNVANED